MPDKLRYLLLSIWNILILAIAGFALLPLWFLKFLNLRPRKPIRSLWAGTPILTLPVLSKSENLLGVESSTLVYSTFFLSESFDYNLAKWCTSVLGRAIIPYGVFIWANWKFDRFHFFCDRGLLPNLKRFEFNATELRVYKILNKEIFFYTYGADVRTRKKTESLGAYNCCLDCPFPEKACICKESRANINFANILNYSKAVFTMGDMIEYIPQSRNDLFFWPVDIHADHGRKYVPHYPIGDSNKPLQIVHASNHRYFKGTKFLLEAVDRLKSKNYTIELILIEKVPNEEALKRYRTADLVFDQCLIGFHGYLSIEAMAIGKPVMSYIRKPEVYLLNPKECPIINCSPEQIEIRLEEFVNNRPALHDLGLRGRQYIEQNYTVEAFAKRLAKIYAELKVKP